MKRTVVEKRREIRNVGMDPGFYLSDLYQLSREACAIFLHSESTSNLSDTLTAPPRKSIILYQK